MTGTNLTAAFEKASTWNWTASTKMVMNLHEKRPPLPLQQVSDDLKDLIAVHVRRADLLRRVTQKY